MTTAQETTVSRLRTDGWHVMARQLWDTNPNVTVYTPDTYNYNGRMGVVTVDGSFRVFK